MSKEYIGLVDNGKVTLKCLGCESDLVVVWDTSNEEKRTEGNRSIVFAKCPFCGDNSKKIDFYQGSSIGIPDSEKISHIDFGDFSEDYQELLPQKR